MPLFSPRFTPPLASICPVQHCNTGMAASTPLQRPAGGVAGTSQQVPREGRHQGTISWRGVRKYSARPTEGYVSGYQLPGPQPVVAITPGSLRSSYDISPR